MMTTRMIEEWTMIHPSAEEFVYEDAEEDETIAIEAARSVGADTHTHTHQQDNKPRQHPLEQEQQQSRYTRYRYHDHQKDDDDDHRSYAAGSAHVTCPT